MPLFFSPQTRLARAMVCMSVWLRIGLLREIVEQDTGPFPTSESPCSRLLKRHGLVKPAEVVGFAAEKEYRRKTSRPNEMWATDAAYFKVMGRGYYYLVTVLDDYSRFILAWRLQQDMTATSLIEVVQEAVDRTGMTEGPLHDRTALLSDNGPGHPPPPPPPAP